MIQSIEITLGPASESSAKVYVRPNFEPHVELDPNWRLHGELRGPRSLYARTLPASFAIEDQGQVPSWLGAISVREPCYWSPDSPFLYDLTLEIRDTDRVVTKTVQTIGIRRLALKARRLTLNGIPQVIRAWRMPVGEEPVDWLAMRREQLALWTERTASSLIAEASELGVLVVGPMVEESFGPAALCIDALTYELVTPPIDSLDDRPTIAVRYKSGLSCAADARVACERLQADCSPHTNLAGYIV